MRTIEDRAKAAAERILYGIPADWTTKGVSSFIIAEFSDLESENARLRSVVEAASGYIDAPAEDMDEAYDALRAALAAVEKEVAR